MGLAGKLSKWFQLWKNQFQLSKISNKKCEENDSILIIKLDAIGDFIIWLDSAKEYRGIFPGKRLILLCSALCKDIAKETGYFDEILQLDISKCEKDHDYFKEKLALLSKQPYGMVIQTTFSRTQHMDILAATIPAYRKIGFVADESRSNVSRKLLSKRNKRILDSFYDELIPTSKENLMEIQRNKEFLLGLGKTDFKSGIPQLPHIMDVDTPSEKYFVVFPGASTRIKMWKTEYFAEVINYIQGRRGWLCLVCGGKDEKPLFDLISERTDNNGKIENLCGKTTLTELIEIVRNSQMVISNDTSGIHYAAATGVKGICPFGEYNYGRFLPYESDQNDGTIKVCSAGMKCRNCSQKHMTLECLRNVLITGRYLCLDKVSPEDVINEVTKIIL